MDEERGSWRQRCASLTRLAAVGGLAAALLGCTGPGGRVKHESERGITEIADWLPGTYDDTAQVRAEEQAGGPQRDAIAVVVVPVFVPSIGDHVFFAEAMLAKDPQRVVSEQLLSFAVDNQGAIVQTNYVLKDPLRWRSAYLNPELFEGLQTPDLKGIAGCPLAWTRVDDKFTATNDDAVCRPKGAGKQGAGKPGTGSGGAGAAAAPRTVLAELTADEYSVVRRIPDAVTAAPASGKPSAPGPADDPLEHFRKRLQ